MDKSSSNNVILNITSIFSYAINNIKLGSIYKFYKIFKNIKMLSYIHIYIYISYIYHIYIYHIYIYHIYIYTYKETNIQKIKMYFHFDCVITYQAPM